MSNRAYWEGKLKKLKLPDYSIINGERYKACGGKSFSVVNPATNQVLTEVTACQKEDIDTAVYSARKVFDSGAWSKLAPLERKTALIRLSQLMLQHQEELALLESISMGKPVNDALNIDIPGAAHVVAWFAESIDKIYDEVAPTRSGAVAMITREAIGVVGAIVP